jgi:diaminopimelate epimerase
LNNIPFFKYQGAGNDFVIIDQRERIYLSKADQSLIEKICDRRFGIGGDGLMLLEKSSGYDFRMVYFNSDGREGSMCGNGGRCIVALAHRLGLIQHTGHFIAIDGPHEARIIRPDYVELKMQDTSDINIGPNHFVLDTGSPHYIEFVKNPHQMDVESAGKAIRYSDRFREKGINVNFVAATSENQLSIATYERGVEAETLACGTGITAAALAYAKKEEREGPQEIRLKAKGGELAVKFRQSQAGFSDIWLCGPATYVFSGDYPKNK